MFDFSWSELAVIGVVALVLIGPKDMPVAIRAIAGIIKKMRRMAGEFQHHVDDMLREADLHEVRSTMRDLRSMNLRSTIERAIDPDRVLTDPFSAHPVPEVPVRHRPAPDFIPPSAVGGELAPLPDLPPEPTGETHAADVPEANGVAKNV